MAHLIPTEEQLAAFASHSHEGVIWMWNLLRFADDAGRDSYQRYVEEVTPLIEKRGGRLVVRSRGEATLIGPETWDEALVVEYPSRAALLDMSGSEAFSKIRVYLAGNNLFYLTGYKGVDPNPRYEDRGSSGNDSPNVLIPGIDRRNTWFRTMSFSLGVNLGF